MEFKTIPQITWDKIQHPDGYINGYGMDLKNVDKFTCNDYFGCFLPVASDDIRVSQAFSGVSLGPAINYQTFGEPVIIPSVYASGTVRLKVNVTVPYATGVYYGQIWYKVVRDSVEVAHSSIMTITSAVSGGDYYIDIPVQAGDIITFEGNTCDGVTITPHNFKVCATETDLKLDTGFDWSEWQT